MLMVDPSSHLFMCQGKQVLPLPFSFDLETSLLFYFHNCLISDIVFWMPVLETVQMMLDAKTLLLILLGFEQTLNPEEQTFMYNLSHTICVIDINDALDLGVGCWALLNNPSKKTHSCNFNLHFQVDMWFLGRTI